MQLQPNCILVIKFRHSFNDKERGVGVHVKLQHLHNTIICNFLMTRTFDSSKREHFIPGFIEEDFFAIKTPLLPLVAGNGQIV